jgi:hypothetical protein
VDCINSRGGIFYTLGAGCDGCVAQEGVFENEKTAPVGPGAQEFARITTQGSKSPTACYPTWYWPAKNKDNGCGCYSFKELNNFYECNLTPVPGHTYQTC